jgi:hypothetical protein
MVKFNFERRAARIGLLKCPLCAPRGFSVDLRGGDCQFATGDAGEYRDLDNLGGRTNETINTVSDMYFDFLRPRPDRFLGDGGSG